MSPIFDSLARQLIDDASETLNGYGNIVTVFGAPTFDRIDFYGRKSDPQTEWRGNQCYFLRDQAGKIIYDYPPLP